MTTLELMQVMCDGSTPLNDIRPLLIATGRDEDEVQEAVRSIIFDDNFVASVRHHKIFYTRRETA